MAGYHDLFPMEEYYKRVVEPLSSRFRQKKGNKRVCPFHNDDKPSMGILLNDDSSEIFYCFGCGKKGNIIMFHQYIQKQYFDRIISKQEALKELCDLFDKNYYDVLAKEDLEQKEDIKKHLTNYNLQADVMTESMYLYRFNEGLSKKKDISYFNDLIIKRIEEINNGKSG